MIKESLELISLRINYISYVERTFRLRWFSQFENEHLTLPGFGTKFIWNLIFTIKTLMLLVHGRNFSESFTENYVFQVSRPVIWSNSLKRKSHFYLFSRTMFFIPKIAIFCFYFITIISRPNDSNIQVVFVEIWRFQLIFQT